MTPWTTARQASLSITNSRNLPKLMSIELVMLSNHLILCIPFSFQLQSFPALGSLQIESVLCIMWPKYWSFSFRISPSNAYLWLISFRIACFDLVPQGTLKSSPTPQFSKAVGEIGYRVGTGSLLLRQGGRGSGMGKFQALEGDFYLLLLVNI